MTSFCDPAMSPLREGTELRVSINLIEDELKLNQAMGRTLEVNNITLADALQGKISGPSNIPGTPEATPWGAAGKSIAA